MAKEDIKHLLGHLLFWVIIMLTYAISEWGYRDNFAQAMLFELLFLPVRLVAVYVNWWLLVPRFLYKTQIISYLLLLVILLFAMAIFQRYFSIYWAYPRFFPDWNYSTNPLEFFRIMQNLVIIFSPVAFSTGIKLFIDWYDQKNRAKQLEIEKTEAELKYLKSQVNPHFLFNSLNSIYGLSLENSQKVPKLLLRLSDFLSYSLYESSTPTISLEKEISLIKNYIALEVERYEERVKIHWDVSENLVASLEIAPLLFIPLVENAFKHGVKEAMYEAQVWISLSQNHEQLIFKVANTIPEKSEVNQEGIGLINLQKRLEILYPDRHELHTEEKSGKFTALLKLNL